mgnify:CR=1 FL=1
MSIILVQAGQCGNQLGFSIFERNNKNVKYLGMTGLGTGVGGLDRREAARQQVKGIKDALKKYS